MSLRLSKRFTRDEQGSLSIEAVFALPMLVWAIAATFVFWDAFKTLNITQKATYTVADMISRESDAIDADFLTSMHELFAYLSNEDGDGNALRITVVKMNEDPDTNVKSLEMVWSEGVGGAVGLENMTTIENRIPDMATGDQLIVVESEQEWAPAFAVGLAAYRFREVALARPRFAPQVKWDDGTATAAATTTTTLGG